MNPHKTLLQFYTEFPQKILTCPLEEADFENYGFIFKDLKEHITNNGGKFDSVLFGVNNFKSLLELDLHDVPYLRQDIDKELVQFIRDRRIERTLQKAQDIKDLDTLEQLRKPLQLESNVSAKNDVSKYFEEFAETAERREKTGSVGLPIDLSIFQQNPLIPNTLLVIGARTSIGKSALALNIAYDLARNGGKVLYLTAEMDYNSILSRFYALATNEPVTDFVQASNSSLVSLAYDKVQALTGDVEFKYCGGWQWEKVKSYILSHSAYDMIVFDHLHYLPTPNNEVQFLTEVINDSKMIAGHLRTVFLMLAQVNRAVGEESIPPKVYHLRGSGGIEQGADMIAMLHRQDRSEPQAEICIAKNRGGQAGAIHNIRIHPKTLKVSEF